MSKIHTISMSYYSTLSKMRTLLSCPDYRIVLVFQAILLQLVVITAIISACIPYLNKWVWHCLKRICYRQLWDKQWLQDKIDAVVECVFNKVLKKHSSLEEGDVYIVLNYKAPQNYTNLLFLTLVFLSVRATVQFWNDFLFEESYECTTKHFTCCYYGDQSLDCSNTSYLEDNNITSVNCYRFVFKLGSATGSALGIVGTIALTILAITWCLLKLSKGSRATRCRAMLTVIFQMTTSLMVLVATALLTFYKMRYYPILSLNASNKVAEIYPIGILIAVYIGAFPWRKFQKNDTDKYININHVCKCITIHKQ